MTTLLAIATILFWGLWLIPAHGVRRESERAVLFYTTLANLLITVVIVAVRRPDLPPVASTAFASVLLGGVIWTVSGYCAFAATRRIGPARAMGIWAPLNLLVALTWGAVAFAELRGLTSGRWAGLATAATLMVVGLGLVVSSSAGPTGDDADKASQARIGCVMALLAGVFWGTYFVPIRWVGLSAWSAALPLAVGMLGTSVVLSVGAPRALRVETGLGVARLLLSGAMWSAGNFSFLLLVERIGIWNGSALAQLCAVVNSLAGIYVLGQPVPGTSAARRTLAGCSLATLGASALVLLH